MVNTLLWTAPPGRLILPVAEIHVFSVVLDLPAHCVDNLERLLSKDELNRAERFRFVRDRLRYIVGRAQLRTILGRYLNMEAAHVPLSYGRQGKPALPRWSGTDRLRFNMSRSHGVGIVALEVDEDIGIDIEFVRPISEALRIAKRFFSPTEYRALSGLPTTELDSGFFGYWTRKEAVVKSIGQGLSYPVSAFTLSLKLDSPPERVAVETEHGTAHRWLLHVPTPCAGYLAALATAGGPRPLKLWALPAASQNPCLA